ncbi:hypothetical protein B0A49_02147 [Cryomyces minteri]|uniref:Xylanolytic transcriptional activator regulatory domain-containing protein n=1 Tax=Cryomyces minteri TaxID=331657 RepID=A0A4U0XNV6_9PEZI|nr:hypothetical protein B0A49_02147 [Cryomyces minteri]
MAKYFEVVDPVYPMINRRTFYADYERFWAKGLTEKHKSDAAMLALHFVMYAMGTQFIEFPSYTERAQTAEFYVSASNQALRISSYLSHLSTRTIQAMILICYFLMNDNHASDAWAFAGIVLRQAYAMGLNRDPDIIVPHASAAEKQQRRKLWQAVMFQDTFLTVLLKLPPTATHSDVSVDSLTEDPEPSGSSNSDDTSTSSNARIINQMSISAIAFSPSAPEPPPPLPPVSSLPDPYYDPVIAKDDVSYIRSMWQLANLVQENLCSPLSLSLPLFSSPRHRASLLSSFRSTHRNFPSSLTLLDYAALQQLAVTKSRRANVNEAAGVECSVRGALEAAHEAIWAFFKLWGLFESEAGLMIANLLSTHGMSDGTLVMDPLFIKCKDDVQRMLQILENGSGSMEMQKTRTDVLRSVFNGMSL